jgi:hypothetical protein
MTKFRTLVLSLVASAMMLPGLVVPVAAHAKPWCIVVIVINGDTGQTQAYQMCGN